MSKPETRLGSNRLVSSKGSTRLSSLGTLASSWRGETAASTRASSTQAAARARGAAVAAGERPGDVGPGGGWAARPRGGVPRSRRLDAVGVDAAVQEGL